MVCKPTNAIRQDVPAASQDTYLQHVERRLGQISMSAYKLAERQAEQLSRVHGNKDGESDSAVSPIPPGIMSSLNQLLDAIDTSLERAHNQQNALDTVA